MESLHGLPTYSEEAGDELIIHFDMLDLSPDSIIDENLLCPKHVSETNKKNIWFFWYTGYNNMDKGSQNIVRACFPRSFVNGTIDGNYDPQFTANLLRWPLLLTHGGVYADIAMIPIDQLDTLWRETISNALPASLFESDALSNKKSGGIVERNLYPLDGSRDTTGLRAGGNGIGGPRVPAASMKGFARRSRTSERQARVVSTEAFTRRSGAIVSERQSSVESKEEMDTYGHWMSMDNTERATRSENKRQAPGEISKPKPKKAKIDRGPALTQPLSILTKDFTHIPIVDIAAFVNRSLRKRQREVEKTLKTKNPGKVKRPMNSFMLYRKAYQHRAKDFCLQHNHQLVSQVCGASWPLEPADVRDQFVEWARIEKVNHEKAHPGYKFTPKRPKDTAPERDSETEDSEDEDEDEPLLTLDDIIG
ncbi:hypothetical protein B7494_g3871 [Chlorociboria aeruginascens]|nr:hypothetical protein B7494_g3871 [Chlorociboria aeruginascens]